MKLFQGGGHDAGSRRGSVADAESLASRFAAHALDGLVRASEHVARFFIKQLARLSKFHRVLAAHQKGHAQFFFEVLHLPAERWLGEVQNLRRTVEGSVGRDGDEIAQMRVSPLNPLFIGI